MKKLFALAAAVFLLCAAVLPAAAEGGNVTYTGDAGDIVFAPGSEHSLTDLFPDFKDVMPGDSLTQTVTVRNDASDQVKVVIYMRSLGAHEDSVDFLSKLGLRVKKSAVNDMAYMFDAAADETAQLTDWVCLGTLYSGGEVNLDIILDVPVELDNSYSERIGYLDWQFRIEEFPVEETDPEAPKTGDNSRLGWWIAIAVCAAAAVAVVLLHRKKERKDNA